MNPTPPADHPEQTTPRISSRHETLPDPTGCAAPGCTAVLARQHRGRPRAYCSPACRALAHRRRTHPAQPRTAQPRTAQPRTAQPRTAQPLTVEVDHGSTSARGRRGGRVWLVRLRRGDRAVILTTGLARSSAEHLAAQLTQLLNPSDAHPPIPNLAAPRPDQEPSR